MGIKTKKQEGIDLKLTFLTYDYYSEVLGISLTPNNLYTL